MYELPRYTIQKITIAGNKHVKIEDLKSNISTLKYTNRPYLYLKLNGYLAQKRIRKDSLNIKQSNLQLFSRIPDVLDTKYAQLQGSKIKNYYKSIGYLNAVINYRIDTLNDKKVKIQYVISEGKPSLFTKNDTLIINNPALNKIVNSYLLRESLVRKNEILSTSILKDEKQKITETLRNQGYFYFNEDQVGIKINDLKDSTLTSISLAYKIPNLSTTNSNTLYDRLFRIGIIRFNELQLEINEKEEKWISKLLTSNQLKRIVTFKEDELFSANRISQSLQNIYSTDQYKSVTIKFDTSATRVHPSIEPNSK